MFQFECPHCNNQLEGDDALAGQKVQCYFCKEKFTVAYPPGTPAPQTQDPSADLSATMQIVPPDEAIAPAAPPPADPPAPPPPPAAPPPPAEPPAAPPASAKKDVSKAHQKKASKTRQSATAKTPAPSGKPARKPLPVVMPTIVILLILVGLFALLRLRNPRTWYVPGAAQSSTPAARATD